MGVFLKLCNKSFSVGFCFRCEVLCLVPFSASGQFSLFTFICVLPWLPVGILSCTGLTTLPFEVPLFKTQPAKLTRRGFVQEGKKRAGHQSAVIWVLEWKVCSIYAFSVHKGLHRKLPLLHYSQFQLGTSLFFPWYPMGDFCGLLSSKFNILELGTYEVFTYGLSA